MNEGPEDNGAKQSSLQKHFHHQMSIKASLTSFPSPQGPKIDINIELSKEESTAKPLLRTCP